jgi:beta-lactamase superfamily II metal-dependent hydrolase
MKLTIHDVGHGGCISLVHSNGNAMLWDVGHQGDNRPSSILPNSGINSVEYLFITNYDEDHVSDMPEFRSKVGIRAVYRNKSISPTALRALKLKGGPISPAMDSTLDLLSGLSEGLMSPLPSFQGISHSVYCNNYGTEYDDTNNISLVTFVSIGGSKFIIPGDLERKGWIGLLQNRAFVEELRGVNVFVASHHGRESGYCKEVFDICSPNVFVFSDSQKQHATQETTQLYAKRAKGIQFNGATRYVLTTRNDGTFSWNFG